MKKMVLIMNLYVALAGVFCLTSDAGLYQRWYKTKGTIGVGLFEVEKSDFGLIPFMVSYGPIGIKGCLVGYIWDSDDGDDIHYQLSPKIYLYLDPLYWNKLGVGGEDWAYVLWQPYLYAGGSAWVEKYRVEREAETGEYHTETLASGLRIFDAGFGMIFNPLALLPIDLRAGYHSASWEEKPEAYIKASVSLALIMSYGARNRSSFIPRLNGFLILSGGNEIHAGEEAQLSIRLVNSGEKSASDISLSLNFSNWEQHFKVPKIGKIKKLKVWKQRVIHVSIQADTITPTGTVQITLTGRDKRGNIVKAQPLEIQTLERLYPADLATTVAFSDENSFIPNRSLDAGERSILTITVRNDGKGMGFDVKLKINSDNPDLTVEETKSLGEIAPNEEETVTVPIKTSLQAKDGFVNILIETKEKRGFDAQKQQIRIPVRHLAAPKLEITSVELNDKQLGNAVGNGNGIPENNETIEIVAFIKNSGVGNAIGTKLDLVSINSGIEVLERFADLGMIRPNQTVKGTLLFRIPRIYEVEAGSTLDYKVRVEDVRGADTAEQTKAVAMSAQQPIFAYSIQAPATLHNGGTAQFQITPKNTGTLPAKGVNVQLSAQGARVTPASVFLGEMAANDSGLAQPFTVTLPRTYTKQNLTLDIKMTQSDFVGLTKTETYPVELIAPDLILTERLFDASGDGKIEQGERVELEITVNNKGKLEAMNTLLKVSTTKPRVIIKPESKSIGTLPENTTSNPMRFTLTIRRGVEAGALPIMLKVTQTDFPAVTKTLEYTIYEVGAATTVVEAKKQTETPQPEAFRGNQPPTILPSVKDNQTIYTPNYQLQVSVSDDRGLTSAQVRLNGRVVYDSQTDPSAADKLSASAGKLLSFTQPLTALKEGANELVLSAVDNNNERAEITIHLNYNPRAQVIAGFDNPSDVDVEIPRGKAQNQNAVALVIGIEKYQNVSPALYGNRDAIAFKQYLIDLFGLNDANILLLTNELATLGGIRTALRKLENLVTPGQSDVFVFYSGHGAPTLDGKQKYFIPYDGDANYPQDSGYSLMNFYDRLSKLNAKSVTVFLDACFSGTDKDNNPIIAAAKPIFPTIEGAGAYRNLEIFSSSTGAQISSSFKEQRHGMFTYFLLKGMRREADSNKDGTITLAELEAYVKKQVSTQARRMGREQEPMLTGKKERVLVRYE